MTVFIKLKRCFQSKKKIYSKCKYGFPFETCDKNQRSPNGISFLYKRKSSDGCVVPYIPSLLRLWNGHINAQFVTQRGIEQYLVKYIAKMEPTLLAKRSEKDAKFSNMRVVSSIEASSLICGHHFVQSTFQVLFVTIPFIKPQFKFLKNKSQIDQLNKEDTHVYKESQMDYYIARPDCEPFNTITYLDYYRNYKLEIANSLSKSKRKF